MNWIIKLIQRYGRKYITETIKTYNKENWDKDIYPVSLDHDTRGIVWEGDHGTRTYLSLYPLTHFDSIGRQTGDGILFTYISSQVHSIDLWIVREEYRRTPQKTMNTHNKNYIFGIVTDVKPITDVPKCMAWRLDMAVGQYAEICLPWPNGEETFHVLIDDGDTWRRGKKITGRDGGNITLEDFNQ